MWISFQTNCKKITEENAPTKYTSSCFSQSWLNAPIKRLSERKQRQFNLAKRSGKESDCLGYKSLRKQQRIEYDYVSRIVAQELDSKPKKFRSYIKSKRCGYVGISPLKDENGYTYTDERSKVNNPNKHFKSMFNNENDESIPDSGASNIPDMES